ncbi:zinc finger MYM-type protein 1-like [Hydra vulgaris]|uniref:Zinc finger MYM-type protein 1-like n=1 Tax=Hydra vulgaris TaxID=6087 RepID=A0ABM4CSA7_HYDVU
MLVYLTRRQGCGVLQKLEEQINEEYNYWEHGLAFRRTNEKFGSLQNGSYLGLLELVSQFDPFLASHFAKYGNSGKRNSSYLSKTICEEFIEIMPKKVCEVIVDEVKASGYFSLSVDSTPDISHIDQLSVVLRYVADGEPIERFLTFLELQNHTGKGMAKQVLQYLREVCSIDYSKCRGQSYDNAANMSGCYKGMQKKILEENEFAIYIPCAAHSLNLVGRSAIDSCLEAVNFHTVQLIYTFFSASTNRWKIQKGCLVNETLVKSLSDTRWDAHAVATEAILKSHPQILKSLECIQEDQTQKGDTRGEAENFAKKMQELEFAFMLVFWKEILQHFHRVSQALQKEHVNLKTCADLYTSLADHLHKSRNEFERFEEAAKIMTPGVDYKSTLTRNRKRKTVFNDGDAPEVSLNARGKFLMSAFYAIVDKLETELSRRRQVYNDVAVRFFGRWIIITNISVL